MQVRATRIGFYGKKRRREGDVFPLTDEKHFSESWMEDVTKKPVATPPDQPGVEPAPASTATIAARVPVEQIGLASPEPAGAPERPKRGSKKKPGNVQNGEVTALSQVDHSSKSF